VGEDGGDVFEEQSPRAGQRNLTACSLEECDTEFGFEHFDVPADCRLGEVQPFGGSTEVELFGDGLKAPCPLQVEVDRFIVRTAEAGSIAMCYRS